MVSAQTSWWLGSGYDGKTRSKISAFKELLSKSWLQKLPDLFICWPSHFAFREYNCEKIFQTLWQLQWLANTFRLDQLLEGSKVCISETLVSTWCLPNDSLLFSVFACIGHLSFLSYLSLFLYKIALWNVWKDSLKKWLFLLL